SRSAYDGSKNGHLNLARSGHLNLATTTKNVDNVDYVKLDEKATPLAERSLCNMYPDTASPGNTLENPKLHASRRLPRAGVFFEPRFDDTRADDVRHAALDACCEYASTNSVSRRPPPPTEPQTTAHVPTIPIEP
ncbi:hypothetical protein, partial [Burkholderia sola]